MEVDKSQIDPVGWLYCPPHLHLTKPTVIIHDGAIGSPCNPAGPVCCPPRCHHHLRHHRHQHWCRWPVLRPFNFFCPFIGKRCCKCRIQHSKGVAVGGSHILRGGHHPRTKETGGRTRSPWGVDWWPYQISWGVPVLRNACVSLPSIYSFICGNSCIWLTYKNPAEPELALLQLSAVQ